MTIVMSFSIENNQLMEFWKISGCFFGPAFPQKTIVFQWKEDKSKFSLDFQFALYDSLKALTGCLENLKNWREDLLYKTNKTSPVSGLKYLLRQYNLFTKNFDTIFDRTMAWFDSFFYFEQKIILFEA